MKFTATAKGGLRPPLFRIFIATLISTLAGCAPKLVAVPVDPAVDFAAHVEHRGLVVDRAQGGEPAVLVPAPRPLFASGPTYLLQAQDKTIAALWVKDPAHVTVREAADPNAPLIGRVEAHWSGGAISLTFKPASGSELQAGTFQRDGFGVPSSLSSQATTVLDVRGMYLSQLRDVKGDSVGWMRVRISPYMEASRVYDGVLPTTVGEPLATAAVALVDSDVDYIENQAVNPYIGN
ncbi:MAG TPA: hypothetical protein VMT89_06880 [Candidatus Acidoferrales bacterium]|nr:hypothetical protein [Candidatus Acidoferrales bacterium]